MPSPARNSARLYRIYSLIDRINQYIYKISRQLSLTSLRINLYMNRRCCLYTLLHIHNRFYVYTYIYIHVLPSLRAAKRSRAPLMSTCQLPTSIIFHTASLAAPVHRSFCPSYRIISCAHIRTESV